MDRREMIHHMTYHLVCATGAVTAGASDHAISQRARELEKRYGLLGAMYVGDLAERLMDYRAALRSGNAEQIQRAWEVLRDEAAVAVDVLPCDGSIGEIAARLSELARAEQRKGGDHAAA